MVYIPREENLSSTKCSRILACIFHPVCYTMFVIFTSKLLSYTYCSDFLFLTIRVRSTAASFGSLLHVMKARRPSCSFVKMFMAIEHDSWIAFLPRNCIIIILEFPSFLWSLHKSPLKKIYMAQEFWKCMRKPITECKEIY